jgi:subtilisin family serine protease
MKRLAVILLIMSSFLALPIRAAETEMVSERDTSLAREDAYVPGELLVKYRTSVRAVAQEYFKSRWGVHTLRNFKRIGVQHLRLPKDMTVEEALKIFRNDPDVEYAEPNYLRYATATIPNDTFFSELWGLDNTGQNVNGSPGTSDADIDAPEAWDITTGNSNVVVAVIDSGVDYNHPDLSNNMWRNPGEIAGNGLDDDDNGKIDDVRGWDFVDEDNDPIDSDDHGTHVAGSIAAVGNNGTGITGVVWTAQIMPLRFLDAFGSGSVADAIEAIDYAIDRGAKIINASYGSYTFSMAEREAIARARDAGILFVAAAGNDNWNNDSAIKHYPSSYDLNNIIAVAASDQDDNLAPFSNYGATSVDLAAPGTIILSTRPDRQTIWTYNFETGTAGWNLQAPWDRTSSAPWSLTDSPAGNYANNINISAVSPSINLLGEAGAKMTFRIRGESERSFDFLHVETATNIAGPWTEREVLVDNSDFFVSGISGSYSQWVEAVVDLGSLDGQPSVLVRFRLETDEDITQDGWYIDDLSVTAADTTYSNGAADYQYLAGTSMAAPHVAGVAALVKALNPSWTDIDIKAAIEYSVDLIPSLSGIIATGGRVNACSALGPSPPGFPSDLSAVAVSMNEIDLSWRDNSNREIGFKIERKTGSGGTYSQIATVGANVTSYSDAGLSESTNYLYRVLAYDSTGDSVFSNESSATTSSSGGGGGGGGPCFVATAAFGLHPG